jgi:hypothetical protein
MEGALPIPSVFPTEDKEKVLLECLYEPQELIELIKSGSIEYGIPELVFESIIQLSGFSLSKEERESILNQNREFLKSDVLSSCTIMVLAAGLMNLEQISNLTFSQLLEKVALAEEVLYIQQCNIIKALDGGGALTLMWDVQGQDEELKRVHAEKQNEVQALLDEQTSGRGGMGIRRL